MLWLDRIPGFDSKVFIREYMDEIWWKPFITQLAAMQPLWFFPEELSSTDASHSIFVSSGKCILPGKIFMLKWVWAIQFWDDYVVEDIHVIYSKTWTIDWFWVKVNGAYKLYRSDGKMHITLQVQEILLWWSSWWFSHMQELVDASALAFWCGKKEGMH